MFTSRGQPVLHCAIYTRQSVARGEQDLTSCEVQRERCEDYVRAMQYEGWVTLDEHFDDLGVSGGNLERPALRRLLSWCVQGRVDVVVVTSIDRLARKMSDWVRLNDWLKQASVELVILQGAGGARGPLAELVNNVVASLAEFERDIISERLREAKGRARAHGRRAAGRVPLGYEADPNTRQLVVDEDEAALVRAFFERCAAGESGASIAAWANDAGHRTKVHGGKGGAMWTGRSVLQVVRNPIYLGRRAHGEGTVEGVHEAIVDEDLARRAFSALDARRTREPSPRSKAPPWDQDPWMLRGLLRCTGCGRVMTTTASAAVTMENADEVPRYYRCRGDAARPACSPPVQVAARHVEARVLTVLREAHISWFRDDRSRGFLEALAPAWTAWQRDDVGARNAMVRGSCGAPSGTASSA
ncbi:MAG: recombinase family protein [Myxococcales bacterium]|nr:recombinase family protein [Myxococcales bacterium]